MRPFVKFLLLSLILSVTLGITDKWYHMFFLGRYWEHASVLAICIVGLVIPCTIGYLSFLAFQKVINLKNQ